MSGCLAVSFASVSVPQLQAQTKGSPKLDAEGIELLARAGNGPDKVPAFGDNSGHENREKYR